MSEQTIANPQERLPVEVKSYLREVIATQQKLIEVQRAHQSVLISGNTDQAEDLIQQERKLQRKLVQLLEQRKQIIGKIRSFGYSGTSLFQLSAAAGWSNQSEMSELLEQTRQVAETLRQQTWSMWAFTQRASRFYQSTYDMIARGGQKQTTYSAFAEEKDASTGGSLLDASI